MIRKLFSLRNKLQGVVTCFLLKGDSLSDNVGSKFSTKERDNDNSELNCAEAERSGWWYNACTRANLNGEYHHVSKDKKSGIKWETWKDFKHPLESVEMKVREYGADVD